MLLHKFNRGKQVDVPNTSRVLRMGFYEQAPHNPIQPPLTGGRDKNMFFSLFRGKEIPANGNRIIDQGRSERLVTESEGIKIRTGPEANQISDLQLANDLNIQGTETLRENIIAE